MKKLLAVCLFFGALFWVLSNYRGLADQGQFSSIALELNNNSPAGMALLKQVAQKYDLEISPTSNAVNQMNVVTLSPNSQCDSNKQKLPEGTVRYSTCTRLVDFTNEHWQEILTAVRQELKEYAPTIEPNYQYKIDFIGDTKPNDPMYGKQWNLRAINIEKAWTRTKGKGVTVAVIDTGVSKVEDLQNTEFVEGYNFVDNNTDTRDDQGHGTHVAGTIAQSTNNNLGVAGIAYEAKIMPIKVLDRFGGGTVVNIAKGIRFAVDKGANIINLSLGGPGESAILKEAIDYAYDKGVTIVAAAGNSDYNGAFYPARYPKVIGVSALAPSGRKAFYSNYGPGVDISAPGGDMKGTGTPEDQAGGILQNTIDPETGKEVYESYQGTSMASPHVAGVSALIYAMGVTKPAEVANVLQQSVLKVEDDPHNYYGAGMLDANQAVELAGKGKLNFFDFFRWLRDNGYLSPRFWIDGGLVSIPLKILVLVVSYLVAWFLQNYFGFRWNWSFNNGVFFGGAGLFLLRGFYVFDLPQFPFRIMGSSIPELGNVFMDTTALNPITASVVIPFLLLLFLLGHSQWKWFAIGSAVSMSVYLTTYAIFAPDLVWITDISSARAFLMVNALLCLGLAYLSAKAESGKVY
jgi:serine protease